MNVMKIAILLLMMAVIPIREASAAPLTDERLTLERWHEYTVPQKAEMFYEYLMTVDMPEGQVAVFYCPSGGLFGISYELVMFVRSLDYGVVMEALINAINSACSQDLQNPYGY